MNEKLEVQAKRLEDAVVELEKAMAHAKVAAQHFRSGEVPRGCAHTLATQGHTVVVNEILNEIAKTHRIAAKI